MPIAKARQQYRRVPMRSCVGCRTAAAKRELTRVVRSPEGRVEVDPTGKRPGRGAYVCHDQKCWERAVNRGGLEHALKTRLRHQDREALLRFAGEALATEVP